MKKLLFDLTILIGFISYLTAGTVDEYKHACHSADMQGCYRLGLAYAQGDGVGKNIKAARSFLQLSCDNGITHACTALDSLSKGDEGSYPVKQAVNTQVRSGNRHYSNGRFGFTLVYPGSIFRQKILSDNGDGIILYNQDKSLELRAYGSWYAESISDSYHDELQWAKESNKRVTYKVLKKNWYVLSGINDQKQTIFYQKSYFKEGKSSSFRLVYPIRDKKKYDSLISTISKNFKWKQSVKQPSPSVPKQKANRYSEPVDGKFRGDIDGDGKEEIIAWKRFGATQMGNYYQLFVLDDDGSLLWEGPKEKDEGNPLVFSSLDFGISMPQLLIDFDHDGSMELLAPLPQSDVSPTYYRKLRWRKTYFEPLLSNALMRSSPGSNRFVWKATLKSYGTWVSKLEPYSNGLIKADVTEYSNDESVRMGTALIRFDRKGATVEQWLKPLSSVN